MRATQVSGIQTSLGSRVRPCLKMDEWVKTVSPKSWHLISIFFANFQNDYLYFSNHFHWWYCKDFFWNQLCTDFIHFKSTFEFILSGISSHRLLGVPNGTRHCCFLLFWKLSHLLPTAIAWHGYSNTSLLFIQPSAEGFEMSHTQHAGERSTVFVRSGAAWKRLSA